MRTQISPQLRRLLGTRTSARAEARVAESAGSDLQPVAVDELLQQTRKTMLEVPLDEIGDPEDYERALGIFLQHADRGLKHLSTGTSDAMDHNAAFALEAVIRTDGTRPSLLVKNGQCDPEHPLAKDWNSELRADPEKLSKRMSAVGRIEPANGTGYNFFGTGWLVDAEKGLVITNLHVLEKMWIRLSNSMLTDGNGGYNIAPGAAFIDFVAESGSLEKKRFSVVGGAPSGLDGPGFQRLDMAVLRIKLPEAGSTAPALPEPIPVIADMDGPSGNISFCFIGYPGPPPYSTGVHDGVDWNWVNQKLFGSKFGVKRLAPATASTPLGNMADDPRRWVFGHDATTLGGSSGSPAISWMTDQMGGIGLHFAGTTLDTNCAHAVVQIRAELEKFGVVVTD